jgi:transcriptional regulator with XRE-family HTH domain
MPPGATSTTTPALRYWRTRRAWVQRELAQHAGVSLISVQRAESGDPLRLTTIRRLAQALGVEPAELMHQPPET